MKAPKGHENYLLQICYDMESLLFESTPSPNVYDSNGESIWKPWKGLFFIMWCVSCIRK